jgi:hypothetical protein
MIRIEICCQAKVDEYDVSILAKQDILRFEVSVDHACCVKAFDAFDNFGGVETGTIPAESAPSAELCGKVPAWMKVENQIEIVLVVE